MTSRASRWTFNLCNPIGRMYPGRLARQEVVLRDGTALQLHNRVRGTLQFTDTAPPFWTDNTQHQHVPGMEARTERDTYLVHAELTQSRRGQNRGGGGGAGTAQCTERGGDPDRRAPGVGAPPPCLER